MPKSSFPEAFQQDHLALLEHLKTPPTTISAGLYLISIASGRPGNLIIQLRKLELIGRLAICAAAIGPAMGHRLAARCAAPTAADADAEPLYRPAVAAHKGDGRPFGQGRTRLLYGKWLGRSQRRADAELRAAGAVPSAVTPSDPMARLTPQELQVVRLAADGTSNKQTGAQLLLSPRTVGCHLGNAFPKLGVTAREELARYAP